jgi:SpoVK/Ycf46/Vps4 family AAA+-type ATPase
LRDELDKYGLIHSKGMILYGPPGNGKTILAKSFSDISGIPNSQTIFLSAPEILSKWVGEGEKNIRNIFDKPKKHPTTFFFIVLDEIDAVS